MFKRCSVKYTVIAICLSLIVGCQKKDDMADLKQFMVDAKNSFNFQKEQLPTLNLRAPKVYASHRLRNPFIMHSPSKKASSDNPLQQYAVKDIKLRGVIAKENSYWAAVELPSGEILEVSVGSKIGTNQGVIKTIDPHVVKIVEQTKNRSGQISSHEMVLKVASGF